MPVDVLATLTACHISSAPSFAAEASCRTADLKPNSTIWLAFSPPGCKNRHGDYEKPSMSVDLEQSTPTSGEACDLRLMIRSSFFTWISPASTGGAGRHGKHGILAMRILEAINHGYIAMIWVEIQCLRYIRVNTLEPGRRMTASYSRHVGDTFSQGHLHNPPQSRPHLLTILPQSQPQSIRISLYFLHHMSSPFCSNTSINSIVDLPRSS